MQTIESTDGVDEALLDSRRGKIVVRGSLVTVASLQDEWYTDVEDPAAVVEQLREKKPRPDLFTFWQRLPDKEPRFDYYMEWDNVAATPVVSFRDWWENRISASARRAVRKSKKQCVEVKAVELDDELARGITAIFNESPVRQGKPMRHYGKDFETVKRGYADALDRCQFLGAYLEGDLIGFMMLVFADSYASVAQIMAKMEHLDKFPNNALIAKAVQICEEKRKSYLIYTKWYHQGVTEFKRRNGFEKIDLPRYYVPLGPKGKVALWLGLHRGLVGLFPTSWMDFFRDRRTAWYGIRHGRAD